jgi:riboflavin synthase
MFTGIVRHIGSLVSAQPGPAGKAMTIDLGPLVDGLSLGDSVAVNGVCLTASAITGTRVQFDVMAQTLRTTTLGDLAAGAKVNLERALVMGATLDGHLVQGHVDGLATLREIDQGDGRQWTLTFAGDDALAALMVPKGSVAIDGVSLTLVDVRDGRFSVSLIPTTREETTLGALAVGARVNIETDVIGKYVRKTLEAMLAEGVTPAGSSLTLDKLRDAGFC